MQGRDVYLDRITTEVEEVASRVTLLKGRFAKQKVSVKLDHYWELDYVRTRFTEFKRRIQQLEDADDQELARIQENVDLAWKDLLQAVDTLTAALN
jgi:Fe-S-cluster formation regulator IscX/YfhJ